MRSSFIPGKIRLIALTLIAVSALGWRTPSHASEIDGNLTAIANFKAEDTIALDTPIEITLSRPLRPGEKVGVLIDQTDLSGLFITKDSRLVYDPTILPLPIGKSILTVHLAGVDGAWKEIARLTLTIAAKEQKPEEKPAARQFEASTRTAKPPTNETVEKKTDEAKANETLSLPAKPTADASTEKKTESTETSKPEKKHSVKFTPSFTISIPAQPMQLNFPADTRPAKRATFIDFDLTGSVKTETKVGGFSSEANFDFAGSSLKDKTLQFSSLGEKAPDVDLSSYLMNFQVGKAKLSLGHTSFGGNRELVNSFSSRGLSLNVPINKRFELTAGILNGTSVLGVGNFFGMARVRHQVQGATLG